MRQRLPRVHNELHLEFIRSLPCVCCGNDIETQAAHIRTEMRHWGKSFTGGGQKPADFWVLPMCGRCHTEQHSKNELKYWESKGINPFPMALSLYAASGDHELAQEVIESWRDR